MLTLERIRKTQAENIRLEKQRKENYKSPSGFTIVSRFMKDKNMDILNKFCDKHNKSEIDRKYLIEKYHKLNYYTPNVSYIKKKEDEQFNDDADNDDDYADANDNADGNE